MLIKYTGGCEEGDRTAPAGTTVRALSSAAQVAMRLALFVNGELLTLSVYVRGFRDDAMLRMGER